MYTPYKPKIERIIEECAKCASDETNGASFCIDDSPSYFEIFYKYLSPRLTGIDRQTIHTKVSVEKFCVDIIIDNLVFININADSRVYITAEELINAENIKRLLQFPGYIVKFKYKEGSIITKV